MSGKLPVLVAIDMSDWAKRAEVRGAIIAKNAADGDVLLSYIQEKSDADAFLKFFAGSSNVSQETLLKGIQEGLQSRADALKDEQGVSVTPIVSVGRITAEIQLLIQKNNAGLLVMGKHGHGYHAVPIIGNTPVKIIQGCPCPVLVVRNNPEHPYKRVLIPVEFTEASAHQVKQALPFIPQDAEITLMHVCMPPTAMLLSRAPTPVDVLEKAQKRGVAEAEASIKEFVDSLGISHPVKTVVKVGLPDRTILENITVNNIDLLVLGKKPRSRLQEYIVGSMVHTGLNEAECDVMITPSLK